MDDRVLSDEEKAHKILEGQYPCARCRQFWEESGVIQVEGTNSHYCIFCYIQMLKEDQEDFEAQCESHLNVPGVRSTAMAAALCLTRLSKEHWSTYGSKIPERTKNVKELLRLETQAMISMRNFFLRRD